MTRFSQTWGGPLARPKPRGNLQTQESFRDNKWFGETTLRGASAELPRHGCHFMNAFVLISLFHQKREDEVYVKPPRNGNKNGSRSIYMWYTTTIVRNARWPEILARRKREKPKTLAVTNLLHFSSEKTCCCRLAKTKTKQLAVETLSSAFLTAGVKTTCGLPVTHWS